MAYRSGSATYVPAASGDKLVFNSGSADNGLQCIVEVRGSIDHPTVHITANGADVTSKLVYALYIL
jgi:hypothetical protein